MEATGRCPLRRARGWVAAGGGGDDSRGPPGQNLSDHLCLILCGGELLGKTLHCVTEEAKPGGSGSPRSGACQTPSSLSGSAIGGPPGLPRWTLFDRGTAL